MLRLVRWGGLGVVVREGCRQFFWSGNGGPWSRAPDLDISNSIARSQAFNADDAALRIRELDAPDLAIVLRYPGLCQFFSPCLLPLGRRIAKMYNPPTLSSYSNTNRKIQGRLRVNYNQQSRRFNLPA
jgi:hypothetical protein